MTLHTIECLKQKLPVTEVSATRDKHTMLESITRRLP